MLNDSNDPSNPESSASPRGTGWRPAGSAGDSTQINTAGSAPGARPPDTRHAEGSYETITGEVREFDHRTEAMGQASEDVYSFLVESYSDSGNRLPPVPVEMRGPITGVIRDGNHVEVYGKWKSGTLQASRIANIDTSGTIAIPWYGTTRGKLWIAAGVLAAPVLFLLVASGVMAKLFGGGTASQSAAHQQDVRAQLIAQCQGWHDQLVFAHDNKVPVDQTIPSEMASHNCLSVGIPTPYSATPTPSGPSDAELTQTCNTYRTGGLNDLQQMQRLPSSDQTDRIRLTNHLSMIRQGMYEKNCSSVGVQTP